MKISINVWVGVSTALLLGSFPATAQVTSTLTHSFPFGGCQTVASDGDTIFMSAGAGIYVLDGSSDDPAFVTTPMGVKSKLNAGGLVRSIDPAESYLYVAATRRGLVRFDRPTTNDAPVVTALTGGVEAWAVTHQPVGLVDVVLVGTNTGDTNGTLQLVLSTESGLEVKDSLSVGGPVYCVASTINAQTEELIVLVGTACSGGSESPDAVQEYDIDISGGVPESLPSAPVGTWSVMAGSSPVPTLVRDVVIDPTGSTAYVATHTRGVHRLTIGGGITETLSYGWPILCESTACRYQGLSIIEVASTEYVLAVGLGLPFPTDRQEWGTCAIQPTCADPETDASASQEMSVQIWSATGGATKLATLSARGQSPPLGGEPVRLSIRPGADSDHFRIDVAALQRGMRVVEATRDESDDWTLEEIGRVDQDFVSDDLPIANVTDLAMLQDTLVVAAESGIATFDGSISTSSEDLLAEPAAYVHTGAVWTTAMGSGTGPGTTGTFPAMIFAFNQKFGVRFIQPTTITDGVVTAMADLTSLDTGGNTFAGRAFPAGTTPDGYPWLFVANYSDTEATGTCSPRVVTGAIRVYRLQKSTHGQIAPSEAVQIGEWVPFACGHSEFDGQRGQLLDLWVEPDGASNYTMWATYGDLSEETPGVGVIAVDAEWVTTPTPRVVCTFLGKAQVSNEATVTVGRLHYRSGSLFASFGCAGVATFSASPGGTPTLLKSLAISGKSVLGVTHGATGDTNLYAACLNGSILAVDTTTTPMSTLLTIPTPYQPQALMLGPSDTSGPAFYVADGGGGLQRIQLSATP